MEILRISNDRTLRELGGAILRYQPPSGSLPERRFKWLLAAALMHVGMFLKDGVVLLVFGEHELPGLPYRLDYAVEFGGEVIGFEIDGLAFHGDQGAFARDRKRDRDLALGGVETYRYTANEITYQWPAVQDELRDILFGLVGDSLA